MKITSCFPLLAFLLLSFSYASAQEGEPKDSPVRFLLKGALEFGGDNVAEVYFTNGEKQSVKAGQGGTIAAGAEFQLLPKLLLHTTIGFKYLTTQADNAHIRLTRVPLQATASWLATPKLRFGAGLVTHQAIRFKGDGIGPDMKFDGAAGPTFEVAYSGFGISYTAMTYKDQQDQQYSANAIGLFFSITAPKR